MRAFSLLSKPTEAEGEWWPLGESQLHLVLQTDFQNVHLFLTQLANILNNLSCFLHAEYQKSQFSELVITAAAYSGDYSAKHYKS